jgi:hypothetical protein
MAAHERQVRAVQRHAEFEHWQELNRQMLSLAFVHRDEFPDVVAPAAPAPEGVDEEAVYGRHERDELASISFWRRSQRREAKAAARDAAAAGVAEERAKREQERVAVQRRLDDEWQRLMRNDHELVLAAIEVAFEDNEMSAAPIDVEGDGASLLMKIASPSELIPEREVTTTPSGKPTHKRRPKGSVNALYAEILASHALATVKEAFAVAPGLQHVRLLVVRGDRLGGGLQLIPLYAGAFDRGALPRTDGKDFNVLGFIEAHGDIRYKGQAQEVAPLATKGDPELRHTVDLLARQLDWKPAP